MYIQGNLLPDLEKTLLSLPVPVVIDHMGVIPTSRGMDSPEFQTLLRLVSSGKCYVKLSGYRSSVQGPPYADLLAPARKIIATAPERCVWGTDWPHTRRQGPLMPDDGKLLDLLYDWAPDPKQLHGILVEIRLSSIVSGPERIFCPSCNTSFRNGSKQQRQNPNPRTLFSMNALARNVPNSNCLTKHVRRKNLGTMAADYPHKA